MLLQNEKLIQFSQLTELFPQSLGVFGEPKKFSSSFERNTRKNKEHSIKKTIKRVIAEEYITRVSEDTEERVPKKLSLEFSRKE